MDYRQLTLTDLSLTSNFISTRCGRPPWLMSGGTTRESYLHESCQQVGSHRCVDLQRVKTKPRFNWHVQIDSIMANWTRLAFNMTLLRNGYH